MLFYVIVRRQHTEQQNKASFRGRNYLPEIWGWFMQGMQ